MNEWTIRLPPLTWDKLSAYIKLDGQRIGGYKEIMRGSFWGNETDLYPDYGHGNTNIHVKIHRTVHQRKRSKFYTIMMEKKSLLTL